MYINSQSSTKVKEIERCKVDIRLHAKLIAIGYNNYLCLNSILENEHRSENGVRDRTPVDFYLRNSV